MIRINLLPQKKTRHTDQSQKSIVLGGLIILLLGVALYVLLHMPLANQIQTLTEQTVRLRSEVDRLTKETKDFDLVESAVASAEEQKKAIQKLEQARAVPAWFLRELSNILTHGKKPTMTVRTMDMLRMRNRRFDDTWDPKSVWIESFNETGGSFVMVGGAKSDSDATQLALRLQASVFFTDVIPEGAQAAQSDKEKLSFYRFTIKGKVRY